MNKAYMSVRSSPFLGEAGAWTVVHSGSSFFDRPCQVSSPPLQAKDPWTPTPYGCKQGSTLDPTVLMQDHVCL